jgi:6-phosphogluconolactonase (cycloisomerase 2 family)
MKHLVVLSTSLLCASAFAAQGSVYTQSNAPGGNDVLAFARSAGALTLAGSYATGGAGTGSGLGSQGAVTLSSNGRFLLVVNAGSNDVSVFETSGGTLFLTDRESSRGTRPTSVAERNGRVYVLNVGDTPNVAGFALTASGDLVAVAAMPASLAVGSAPAQVGIGRGGAQVFVTERATNLIDVFAIQFGGALGSPTQLASAGATPFGFEFGRHDTLIVSEAAGGAADASSVSSYKIGLGALTTITPALPTNETAACWIILARSQRFAYTTNTASGTVTGYRVTPGTGALTRLDGDGVTGDLGAGSNPLDGATSQDGRYLFVLSPATAEIASFFVRVDGSLEKLPSRFGLPSTAFGLAAR